MLRRPLIAALGSSFASGPLLEPYENAAAQRSRRNYAHLLADHLGADLVDLTVGGATTATILAEPQTIHTGEQFAPQIDGVAADTDIITITAGGNDLGLIGSMVFAAVQRTDPDGPVMQYLAAQMKDALSEPTPTAVRRTASGLARIVDVARAKAPGARVLLVDYLTILSEEHSTATRSLFTPDQVALFLRIQDALGEAHRQAAGSTSADLIKASDLSRAHAIGSSEPWVFGFEPSLSKMPAWFHPNATGMIEVSREIVRHLALQVL